MSGKYIIYLILKMLTATIWLFVTYYIYKILMWID